MGSPKEPADSYMGGERRVLARAAFLMQLRNFSHEQKANNKGSIALVFDSVAGQNCLPWLRESHSGVTSLCIRPLNARQRSFLERRGDYLIKFLAYRFGLQLQ